MSATRRNDTQRHSLELTSAVYSLQHNSQVNGARSPSLRPVPPPVPEAKTQAISAIFLLDNCRKLPDEAKNHTPTTTESVQLFFWTGSVYPPFICTTHF